MSCLWVTLLYPFKLQSKATSITRHPVRHAKLTNMSDYCMCWYGPSKPHMYIVETCLHNWLTNSEMLSWLIHCKHCYTDCASSLLLLASLTNTIKHPYSHIKCSLLSLFISIEWKKFNSNFNVDNCFLEKHRISCKVVKNVLEAWQQGNVYVTDRMHLICTHNKSINS